MEMQMSKVIATRELGNVLVSPTFARTLEPGDWLVNYQRAQTDEGTERAAYVVRISAQTSDRIYLVLQDRTGFKPWLAGYGINESIDRVVGSRADKAPISS